MTPTNQPADAFAARNAPRIFCIGRNYADHIAELDHGQGTQECVVFMKPPSALVAPDEAILIPADRGAVHYEAELVVEIREGGANITPDAARQHISAVGLGLDLTLRDLQNELKATGEPWERCKSFDYSAPLAPLRALDDTIDLNDLHFGLRVNGELRQSGATSNMLVGVAELMAMLSDNWRLLPGDLIYTGTPEGIGAIQPGDVLDLAGGGLPAARWTIA